MTASGHGGARRRSTLALAVVALLGWALTAGCQEQTDQDPARAPDEAPTATATAHPTLLEIMRQLEVDMERVAHGVWVADHDSIAAGARAIADHPKVGPTERAEILETLGDGAAGFREADMAVHNAAVTLAERARKGQMPAVLDALSTLQSGCVSCHIGYRESLRASGPEPPGPGGR